LLQLVLSFLLLLLLLLSFRAIGRRWWQWCIDTPTSSP
jgi:hypothetical protein